MNQTHSNGTQVIVRAAKILKMLGRSQNSVNITQLAKMCDLPRSTVHRLVCSLEEQQLVINGKDGVRLGPALLTLATAAHTDFVTVARPAVESLGRKTRETVDVSVFRDHYALSVDQYESDQELRVVSPVGTAFPLNCTAHGKALLSELENINLSQILKSDLEPCTSNSIVDKPLLLKEIETSHKLGYAIDMEEHAEGVCGVGFAIRCSLHLIYAVSLAVPAQRFHRNKDKYITCLLKTKFEIEQRLTTASYIS